MHNKNKPGEIIKKSGTYEQIGPRGGKSGETAKVKVGDPYPPTSKPNRTWKKK